MQRKKNTLLARENKDKIKWYYFTTSKIRKKVLDKRIQIAYNALR